MKNPLNKRIKHEFKSEIGKYIVIFLFLVGTIGFVSGYIVADNSMQIAYNESFTKQNIEDGHFDLYFGLGDELKEKIEVLGVKLYDNSYKELTLSKATYRIFRLRKEVNLISLMEGSMPQKEGDIVIDRLFAQNNGIEIERSLKLGSRLFKVCGFVAFSDYSALFKNNTDLMFDAQNFTVAAVCDDDYNALATDGETKSYSFKFNDQTMNETARRQKNEELMKYIAQNAVITNYIAREDNNAINFTGDDMGSDKSMVTWLLYIIIAIMAFIFAVTTSNTIDREASVIGTLRASGYTKKELLEHYLILPVCVTGVGAVLGNILGYTIFKFVVAQMYYGSYSLPTYQTVFSAYAFVMTTVVPCFIMLFVNLLILKHKLSFSPLEFLRHDLKKRKNQKAAKLPNFRFINRFRLRVLLQNRQSYAILLVGILFSNLLLMFGLMMTPLLENYRSTITSTMISSYQYILKAPQETTQKRAEKFAATSLNLATESIKSNEELTVYGAQENSKYLKLDFEKFKTEKNGVYVSSGVLDKFKIKIGDSITLKERFEDKTYVFKIIGSYYYPASLCLFMPINSFRTVFETENDYFTGYFSNSRITDIDSNYIASKITQKDLTVVSDQLQSSVGSMFPLLSGFAVLMFVLMVYLLSKIILEKNSISISMVKILGYNKKEIASLYIASTAVAVLASTLISLPVSSFIIEKIYRVMMFDYPGWMTLYIAPSVYVKIVLFSLVGFAVTGAIQISKISKIPMNEALKNRE